jgi:hypothetical protein
MNPQWIEIASWRMVSELHRRYPDLFNVIETHPGGGQYDCLSLYDHKERHIADFNRRGSLHVFAGFGDSATPGSFDIWSEMSNSEHPKITLDQISAMLAHTRASAAGYASDARFQICFDVSVAQHFWFTQMGVSQRVF